MPEQIMSLWQVRLARDQLRDARDVSGLCHTVEELAKALRQIRFAQPLPGMTWPEIVAWRRVANILLAQLDRKE